MGTAQRFFRSDRTEGRTNLKAPAHLARTADLLAELYGGDRLYRDEIPMVSAVYQPRGT